MVLCAVVLLTAAQACHAALGSCCSVSHGCRVCEPGLRRHKPTRVEVHLSCDALPSWFWGPGDCVAHKRRHDPWAVMAVPQGHGEARHRKRSHAQSTPSGLWAGMEAGGGSPPAGAGWRTTAIDSPAWSSVVPVLSCSLLSYLVVPCRPLWCAVVPWSTICECSRSLVAASVLVRYFVLGVPLIPLVARLICWLVCSLLFMFVLSFVRSFICSLFLSVRSLVGV